MQPLSSRNAHFLEDVRTRLDEVSDIKCIISVVMQCYRSMTNEKEEVVSYSEGRDLYCCVLGQDTQSRGQGVRGRRGLVQSVPQAVRFKHSRVL